MNESARLSSKVIPAIWPRMLDLKRFKTRGFSRILMSSLRVLLARSAADRNFLMVLYRLDPLGISLTKRGYSLIDMCFAKPVRLRI